jgi:hypothetical protein
MAYFLQFIGYSTQLCRLAESLGRSTYRATSGKISCHESKM